MRNTLALSLLGAAALATAPLAMAEDSTDSFRARIFGAHVEISDEAKTAIEACHQKTEADERRSCMEAVRTQYDLPVRPRSMRDGKPGFRFGSDVTISDEAKAAIKACHESNDADREAMKTCMNGVKEQYDLPEPPMGRGMKFGHRMRGDMPDISAEAKAAMKACHEQNGDRDAKKTCMEGVKTQYDLPEAPFGRGMKFGHRMRGAFGDSEALSADARERLKACRENGTREEVRSCVLEVKSSLSAE